MSPRNKIIFLLSIVLTLAGCQGQGSSLFYGYLIDNDINRDAFNRISIYKVNETKKPLGIPDFNNIDLMVDIKDAHTLSVFLKNLKNNSNEISDLKGSDISNIYVLIANGNANNYLYLVPNKDRKDIFNLYFPSRSWDNISYRSPSFTAYFLKFIEGK